MAVPRPRRRGAPSHLRAARPEDTGDFLDEVVARLPSADGLRADGDAEAHDDGDGAEDAGEPGTAIPAIAAIVGRPNVGKSTLFNRLIGDDRSVVHDLPGTTRDAIDTVVDTPDGPIRYVDTAGMRRKSRIDDPTEYYSLVRALRAVDESDIAVLVIDATDGVPPRRTSGWPSASTRRGVLFVVLLNKWECCSSIPTTGPTCSARWPASSTSSGTRRSCRSPR